MFSRKPLSIPSKADALPGRAQRMQVPGGAFRQRTLPARAAVSRGPGARKAPLRWVVSGSRTQVLARDGVYTTAVGACGWRNS